jgi:hypothetical protein
MTKEEILARLEAIRIDANKVLIDDQFADVLEDELWTDFMRYVASGPTDPELSEKARLVLSSLDIKFHRWYGGV